VDGLARSSSRRGSSQGGWYTAAPAGARFASACPRIATLREAGIHPYEIMIILDPEADEEQQQEILERVQQLIRDGGGEVEHVDDWGRRKIAYPIAKRADGRYVVVTAGGAPRSLEEIGRVLSISDVVLRAFFIRLDRAQAERARAVGAPAPVDAHPEGESRPPRGGRGGPRGRRPR
jgi:small subunit ribosomal protein S6